MPPGLPMGDTPIFNEVPTVTPGAMVTEAVRERAETLYAAFRTQACAVGLATPEALISLDEMSNGERSVWHFVALQAMPTPCEARMADISRSLELLWDEMTRQGNRQESIVAGINSLGTIFNGIMEQLNGFRETIGKMGPMGLLKMMKGGKPDGD